MNNKNQLNKLSVAELGKLFPIKISPYNPKWTKWFEEEKKEIIRVLGKQIALKIVHFGSTAISNLDAKSTIDILVEIPKKEHLSNEITIKMTKAGYEYILRKDCPPPYMMFVKGYSIDGLAEKSFHLHVAPADHSRLWDRLYFRYNLLKNPKIAQEYLQLKKELAKKEQFNREAYTEGKTEFVKKITDLAKQKYGFKFKKVSSRK